MYGGHKTQVLMSAVNYPLLVAYTGYDKALSGHGACDICQGILMFIIASPAVPPPLPSLQVEVLPTHLQSSPLEHPQPAAEHAPAGQRVRRDIRKSSVMGLKM
jgi:hypothetical protein